MSETVLVNRCPGREKVYHTNESCSYLKENPQEWVRETAEAWEYTHCKWCAEEFDWSRLGASNAEWGGPLR